MSYVKEPREWLLLVSRGIEEGKNLFEMSFASGV